jgi:hypothetical protein
MKQDKIREKYTEEKIREIYSRKIEKLKKDGFYLNIIMPPPEKTGGKSLLDFTDEVWKKYSKTEFEFISLKENYKEMFTWVDIDGKTLSSFQKVDPEGFTFDYVDFENFREVFDAPQIVYLNPFWGIFIKNDRLKVDSVVQYDFDTDTWVITNRNLYDWRDGSKNVLPLKHPTPREITGGQHTFRPSIIGAVVDSFEDFVEKVRNVGEYDCKKLEAEILEIGGKLSELKKKFVAEMTRNVNKYNYCLNVAERQIQLLNG